jgi:hypothetical protein
MQERFTGEPLCPCMMCTTTRAEDPRCRETRSKGSSTMKWSFCSKFK